MKAHKDEVQMSENNHGERITRLEVTQDHVFQALVDIRTAIKDMDARLNARMDRIEGKMDKIESRIDRIDSRIWTLHFWNLGGFATILGLISKGFGWI